MNITDAPIKKKIYRVEKKLKLVDIEKKKPQL